MPSRSHYNFDGAEARVRHAHPGFMTDVLRLDPHTPDAHLIRRASERLRAGGLVAFPTETVYGLGAHALDDQAVERIFTAKQRPMSDPLIVHVAASADIPPLVARLPAAVEPLAQRFWPGPLTLVLPRGVAVPAVVTAGLDSVALRIPSHPVAQALLRDAALPVVAPSANLFSRPSPTTAVHVLDDLEGCVDIVLDAGPTDVGLESTVLDLCLTPPLVRRRGVVSLEQLRTIVPDVEVRDRAIDHMPTPAPGMLPRHYAPKTPLTLYVGDSAAARARLRQDAQAAAAAGVRVGVLVSSADASRLAALPARIIPFGPENDPRTVAARIYAALRELDRAGLNRILARDIPGAEGLVPAIRDRLVRAAGGRVIPC